MNRVDILNHQYNLCSTWEDVTLSQFQLLCSITIPERYREFVMSCFTGKDEAYQESLFKLTKGDLLKTLPEYYGRVIAIFSDVPIEIIDRLHRNVREQIYDEYLYPFVASYIAGVPLYYQDRQLVPCPREKSSYFTYKTERYYYPESLVYGSQEIPMYSENILTFSEASDIEVAISEWGEKGIFSMAQMIATYCRPEGEAYDPEKTLKRIEEFKNLPMSVVWEVFFYITELGMKSVLAMLLYSNQLDQARLELKLNAVASQILEHVV